VHDLAWAYSGVPGEVWETVRVRAPRPFDNYDPVTLFSFLTPGSKSRVIRDALLYVKASASRGQLTLPLYLYALNRFFGRELKLTDVEKRIIEVLSTNPYANTKEIKEKARVSEASISRSLRKLRAMGYIFGPENVKLWKLGLTTVIAPFLARRSAQAPEGRSRAGNREEDHSEVQLHTLEKPPHCYGQGLFQLRGFGPLHPR